MIRVCKSKIIVTLHVSLIAFSKIIVTLYVSLIGLFCIPVSSEKTTAYVSWIHLFYTQKGCNTLQHTLQLTATHCNTHCNSLQHTATHCNSRQHTATHCNSLRHNRIHPFCIYVLFIEDDHPIRLLDGSSFHSYVS